MQEIVEKQWSKKFFVNLRFSARLHEHYFCRYLVNCMVRYNRVYSVKNSSRTVAYFWRAKRKRFQLHPYFNTLIYISNR